MSEAEPPHGVANDQDVTVYIARDGAEIGECRRADLEQLLREGELRATDHYWHEGMEDWLPLERLPRGGDGPPPARPLQIEATQRLQIVDDKRPAKPEPEPQAAATSPTWNWQSLITITPELRKHLMLAGMIVGGFVLALVIAVVVIRAGHDSSPVQPPATNAPTPIADRDEDLKLRDKAAAELRARIERLPARAEPPLYTFYYDVAVDMRRAGSVRAPWEALVRGSENTVDPQSEQTTRRTEFILRTEYRDGQWTFKHYKASTRNLDPPGEAQEEADERTPTPPALVTMLGLKIAPPDGR